MSDDHTVSEFGAAVLSRNDGLLTAREQAAVRAATIVVAGCGSVGGAVVEPLVRLGATRLRLADPDVYEVTNLNRQACFVDDVGRPKAEVLGDRARAINPWVDVEVYPDGLTEENLDQALDGSSIVFDGIDPEQSAWVKYLLHQRAAMLRIPVIAGADFGGKPTLYVFDYRRDDRPLYGKATAEAHKDGHLRDALRWLGYVHFPRDFLPVMRDRLRTGEAWPQIAYCVYGMGALGSRLIIDLLMGRRVRRVVSVDIHQATRPRSRAALESLRLPLEVVGTAFVARRHAQAGRPMLHACENGASKIPAVAAVVADAGRRAPSPHNTQPWRFDLCGATRLRIGWDSTRWLVDADPLRRGVGYALGCAVESMNYVAEGEWQPSDSESMDDSEWYAGEFVIGNLRENLLLSRQGLLECRSTNRSEYLRTPLDDTSVQRIVQAASEMGVTATVVSDRRAIDRLASVKRDATLQLLANDAYVQELWSWMRLTRGDTRTAIDGFLPEALELNPLVRTVFRMLTQRPRVRRAALDRGLARAIADDTRRTIESSGSLIVILSEDDSVQGRIAGGRAMMRVWLRLTEAGYGVHPQHAALTDGAGMETTLSALEAPSGGIAVTVLRTGRPKRLATIPSPRLPIAAVLSTDAVERTA